MSQEQRNTLRGAFPNQDIFIVDEDNNVLGGNSPQARAYFAERLYGLSGKAPTLQAFAGIFVRNRPQEGDAQITNNLPEELLTYNAS